MLGGDAGFSCSAGRGGPAVRARSPAACSVCLLTCYWASRASLLLLTHCWWSQPPLARTHFPPCPAVQGFLRTLPGSGPGQRPQGSLQGGPAFPTPSELLPPTCRPQASSPMEAPALPHTRPGSHVQAQGRICLGIKPNPLPMCGMEAHVPIPLVGASKGPTEKGQSPCPGPQAFTEGGCPRGIRHQGSRQTHSLGRLRGHQGRGRPGPRGLEQGRLHGGGGVWIYLGEREGVDGRWVEGRQGGRRGGAHDGGNGWAFMLTAGGGRRNAALELGEGQPDPTHPPDGHPSGASESKGMHLFNINRHFPFTSKERLQI